MDRTLREMDRTLQVMDRTFRELGRTGKFPSKYLPRGTTDSPKVRSISEFFPESLFMALKEFNQAITSVLVSGFTAV